jgi:hypothetical protein
MTFEIAKRQNAPISTSRIKRLPTKTEILKFISYDPEEGSFVYNDRIDALGRKQKTKSALSFDQRGYLRIYFNRKIYYAHRIAFKLFYGDEPFVIDHINGNRSDNRISNLRSASHSLNSFNRMKNKNKILPKGVTKAKKKYQATIYKKGTKYNLGIYKTIEEARDAYCKGAIQYAGNFAKFN